MDSKEYTFRNASLPQYCFDFFADIKNEKKFCDVVLTVGKQRISAHRLILAAAIPLFREALLEEEEISLPDIDFSVLECLIDYSYTCELKITIVNVKGLLAGACVLRMKDVQDACCDFLSQRLNAENVLNVRHVATEQNISDLKEFADLYIKENFENVSKTEGFLDTPLMYVRELIGKDDLNVVSEETVLESVLRWVKASLSERKDNLTELLQKVRMVLLKPLYLRDLLEREELIRTSPAARDLIDEARDYHLFPERRKAVCSFSTETRQFMKICTETEETGGSIYSLDASCKYSVLQLDLVKETWSTKSTKEYGINDGCAGALNKMLYFFHETYTMEYDPVKNDSRLFNPFATPKKFAAAASLRGKIFVCGGYVGKYVASNVVECFDPGRNISTQVNSLLTARWGLKAISLGDYIYAVGGTGNQNVYRTVERYNFNTDKWQYVSSMLIPRRCADAAVLNGRIYVCGGYTDIFGYKSTGAAEIYDPLINRWKLVSPMNTERGDLRLVAFCGKLYAIGGLNSHGVIRHYCEIFDPETSKWIYGPSVSSGHFSSAAVVM